MTRKLAPIALTLCLAVSLAHGEPRGREAEKPRGGKPAGQNQPERKPEGRQGQEARGGKPGGNQPPGGAWSERTHSGKQTNTQHGKQGEEPAATGAAAGNAAGKNKAPQATGRRAVPPVLPPRIVMHRKPRERQGAAAGAAAANRRRRKLPVLKG